MTTNTKFSRRGALGLGLGAVALPAFIRDRAHVEGRVVVGTWGGDYARLLTKNVEDPLLKQRLLHEVLGTALRDNVKARALQPDGHYERVVRPGPVVRSQQNLLENARAVVAVVPNPNEAALYRLRAHEADRQIRIDDPPAGSPLQPGLACLTAHAHDPSFGAMQNFQVRGDLVPRDDSWALIPHKLVGGLEAPPSRLALIRANAGKAIRFRRTAKRELARRG